MRVDRRLVISLAATALFILYLVYANGASHSEVGVRAGNAYWGFVKEMLCFLPMMFLLIGIFEVFVPRELVEKHIGDGAGMMAILWVILLAMLQAGPLYGAFPVAAALAKKGCAARNIFIYLGAFSVMKLPMISFEISFLGWKFSFVRLALTLPVFIIIGCIMGRSHKCLAE